MKPRQWETEEIRPAPLECYPPEATTYPDWVQIQKTQKMPINVYSGGPLGTGPKTSEIGGIASMKPDCLCLEGTRDECRYQNGRLPRTNEPVPRRYGATYIASSGYYAHGDVRAGVRGLVCVVPGATWWERTKNTSISARADGRMSEEASRNHGGDVG